MAPFHSAFWRHFIRRFGGFHNLSSTPKPSLHSHSTFPVCLNERVCADNTKGQCGLARRSVRTSPRVSTDFAEGRYVLFAGSLCVTLRRASPCGPSGSLRSGNQTTSSRAHLASALKSTAVFRFSEKHAMPLISLQISYLYRVIPKYKFDIAGFYQM